MSKITAYSSFIGDLIIRSVFPSTIKILSIFVAIVLLFVLVTSAKQNQGTIKAQGGVLLESSFERGMIGFTPFLNYWRLNDRQWYWADGAVQFDPNIGDNFAHDALLMYTGSPNTDYWHNYTLEADVKGRYLGLWFRGEYRESDESGHWVSGYGVTMVWPRDYIKLMKYENNHFADPTQLDITEFQSRGDVFYHIRVTVSGPRIRVWVDDVLYFDRYDYDYQYGTVGFKSYKHRGTFDNILVYGTRVEPLPLPTIPPPIVFCDDNGNPTSDVTERVYTAIGCIPVGDEQPFTAFILGWGSGIAGGIVLILIVVAGIMFITSGGDPKRMQAAKELLTAAISGLLLLIFGVFILEFIGVDILNIPGFGG
ncbi:hypothetical protein ACFL25_00270 [Patescibacteria group bacterium]